MDRDGDGKITTEELFNGFLKIYANLKKSDLQKEVDKAFASEDLDGDGGIDLC